MQASGSLTIFIIKAQDIMLVRDSLCARSRRDLWCKRCSRGDVLTADLKSEESWLVALALKGSLSILCTSSNHLWLLRHFLDDQMKGISAAQVAAARALCFCHASRSARQAVK